VQLRFSRLCLQLPSSHLVSFLAETSESSGPCPCSLRLFQRRSFSLPKTPSCIAWRICLARCAPIRAVPWCLSLLWVARLFEFFFPVAADDRDPAPSAMSHCSFPFPSSIGRMGVFSSGVLSLYQRSLVRLLSILFRVPPSHHFLAETH